MGTKDKPQWGSHTIKGDKNIVVYKIFDGEKDNEFDTYLAINNAKRQVIHNCEGYEAMAAWIDLYLIANEHGVWKSVIELMDEWLETATLESFIEDCKEFGIEFEEIKEEKSFNFINF